MKKRYIYSILFGIPGFIVSAIVSALVLGSVAGVLWIFALGDNPWPASIENGLSILALVVFLAGWAASIIIGFVIGKRLEQKPGLNKIHIWISLGLVIGSILCIGLYQLRIGNIGPRSEDQQCSDYCIQRGYSGSSLSPQNADDRTCGCIDDSGHEVITVPIGDIDPGK